MSQWLLRSQNRRIQGCHATCAARITEKSRPQPTWPKVDIFAKLRPRRLTEIEREEDHCLEAMVHWRDRLRDCDCFDADAMSWLMTIRLPVSVFEASSSRGGGLVEPLY